MALSLLSTTLRKVEGTTQTFGQLILLGADSSISSKTTQISTIAPQDTIVKVVTNESAPSVSTTISDTDRSKIAVSAISDSKEPTVALAPQSLPRENMAPINVNVSAVVPSSPMVAIVLGSAIKTKAEIKKVLTEAAKVDLMISMKSKMSEELEFNNLKQVDLIGDFTYNFFVPEEQDILTQEDQSRDPLLKRDIFNVPRYVELKWTPIAVTEYLTQDESGTSREIEELKRETFAKPRGVAGFSSMNFQNSFEKSRKKTNLLNREGVKMEVVDLHRLDIAMDSTSNKNVFSNSVNTVFSVAALPNIISKLPLIKR